MYCFTSEFNSTILEVRGKIIKLEFINECIKNRKYLGFTYKDMSNCLIDVTEKDYEEFENGNYAMSKENVDRLVRVLCIEKPVTIDPKKYLDTSGLTQEEIEDLSHIVSLIVGEDND